MKPRYNNSSKKAEKHPHSDAEFLVYRCQFRFTFAHTPLIDEKWDKGFTALNLRRHKAFCAFLRYCDGYDDNDDTFDSEKFMILSSFQCQLQNSDD